MRACGILMPVFSLPGPFGIGTLGKEAFAFVDFLARAKQTYWQILPIGPTGYGDSPYQSFSAFAGNPYFIDFRVLHEQGYLTADEIPAEVPAGPVDYGVLYQQRPVVLQKAADRLLAAASVEYKDFCTAQSFWLDDYALFMAVKAEQGQAGLCDWPDDLRTRQPAAVAAARERLAGQVDYFKAVQFFFYTQWNALKAYANSKGIQLVGDIPIYVSPDSSDLWTRPELFQTDGQTHLTQVAGCPPDAFAADGQLWGNPLYDWKKSGDKVCAFWFERVGAALEMFDVVRFDHFRGFADYWAIPAGAKDARKGSMKKGPGIGFFEKLRRRFPKGKFVAEDLGLLSKAAFDLRDALKIPSMAVLQFAFGGGPENPYLPHNIRRGCVYYTGTHDNDTSCGWYANASEAERDEFRRYFRASGDCPNWDMIHGVMMSVAQTAIFPMQDIAGLGSECRTNTPGAAGGNWQWRLLPEQLARVESQNLPYLRGLVELSGRLRQKPAKKCVEI